MRTEIHKEFTENAVRILAADTAVLGLAAGGSWIDGRIDEFSDIDLTLVTETKISGDAGLMNGYATKLGNLLNAFTGEHVGEPRLLICMYDNPLLHVDIKFVALDEFGQRVENPVILFDRNGDLGRIIRSTEAHWPPLDYQWIEDRFWTWIHYAASKAGRGEYFEALDFLAYLRLTVLSPLMQIKNGQLPRGSRKVETMLADADLKCLKQTAAKYSADSIINAVEASIEIYRELRKCLFKKDIILRSETEKKCTAYFYEIKERIPK